MLVIKESDKTNKERNEAVTASTRQPRVTAGCIAARHNVCVYLAVTSCAHRNRAIRPRPWRRFSDSFRPPLAVPASPPCPPPLRRRCRRCRPPFPARCPRQRNTMPSPKGGGGRTNTSWVKIAKDETAKYPIGWSTRHPSGPLRGEIVTIENSNNTKRLDKLYSRRFRRCPRCVPRKLPTAAEYNAIAKGRGEAECEP